MLNYLLVFFTLNQSKPLPGKSSELIIIVSFSELTLDHTDNQFYCEEDEETLGSHHLLQPVPKQVFVAVE